MKKDRELFADSSGAGRGRADRKSLRQGLLWAVAEHLHGLDTGDAVLVDAIQNGRPSEELIETFLGGYGLRRGNAFTRRNTIDGFIDIAERRFRPTPADLAEADRTWHLAVQEFRKQVDANLYSAFLKFYWFYQPSVLTMYDSFARKGLLAAEELLGIQSVRRAVTERDFLARFDDVFRRLAPEIRKAIRIFPRRCPYERRVLDKYLWLLGLEEDQREIRLCSFTASLKLAPFRATK
jgi:hypothetical protein